MRHNYRNEYANVAIRQVVEGDLECLRQWRNNPSNTKYLKKIPYITSEMQENWFREYLQDETEMIFAIEERENICSLTGSMALYNFDLEKAEFGRMLIGNSNAHGLNVALNAIKALKEIAQNELNLRVLYLHVYKDNIPALKIYKEIGFIIDSEYVSENGLVEYQMSASLV